MPNLKSKITALAALTILALSPQMVQAAPGIKIGEYEPCQPHAYMDRLLARNSMKFKSEKPHPDGTLTLYYSQKRSRWAIFLIPDENVEYMCFLSEGKGKITEPKSL